MKRREALKATAAIAAFPWLKQIASPMVNLAPAKKQKNINNDERIKRFGDGRDWFFENRFGMFVHWGLYAIPAWHEQYQWRAHVPRAEYEKFALQWNPTNFDPHKWLDMMEVAGMKYICFTTKHHDGFCMWDTKETNYNTVNTPYKKDILAMLAEACHQRKIPLCLYYSVLDWHHPNYPNLGRDHELQPQKGDKPDWDLYLSFLRKQVTELCTNYGEIHGFWWDMNSPKYHDPSINALIRKLQPKAVINNRGFDEGDFGTPERDYDASSSKALYFTRPTEANQSVGMESWGYKKDEDYYANRYLEKSIDSYLTRDANYLLNVGPDAKGLIPEKSVAILKHIGGWYHQVKESLADAAVCDITVSNPSVALTQKDKTLFVHLNKENVGDGVKLRPINVLPINAVLLNTGQKVETTLTMAPSDHVEHVPYLRLRGLPVNEMADTVLVVKLDFDRPIREIFTNTKDNDLQSQK